MAATEVLEPMEVAQTMLEPPVHDNSKMAGTEDFDPKKHLNFKPPSKVYTMTDLKLPESTGVSPFAVSEPFQLFTQEAIERMRKEIFKPEVMDHYQYSSNLAQCQLRGYAAKYVVNRYPSPGLPESDMLMTFIRAAPFIYDTWKHPETLAIVSKIAGVDLVPEMDFEIAHINLSQKTEKQKAEELEAIADRQLYEADEGIAGCPWEDDKPIVDWHTDSYPFVCVTMLSDCTSMIGGETALRTGDGEIVKVRGPQMVSPPPIPQHYPPKNTI